ncbi:DUF732 domain-containing protein [Mycobacterium sp. SP-6446]|uniref:DUF732 domain-containing protein n=1 Tax=Mycobacterium sp. SP-6446 TaxID=1834162 RepID=UPI00096D44F3|nr:hypothetical protein A5736_21195 [Mycobacterium sp. SP-6446]
MKLLLTLTSFAAIIGMAMPAHADSTDDAFIASLKAAGITYSDPDAAVGAGKWVCDKVNGGTDVSSVVKTLATKNAALNPDKATKFAAIAANAYCPGAISTTDAPVSAPSSVPSSAPSSAPVSAPSSAPVSAASSAPSDVPTSAPSSVPRSTLTP